jgi:putative acetyltransferase
MSREQAIAPSETHSLREARPGDEARIRAVVFSVLEEYGLSPDTGGIDKDLEDIAANYGARGGSFRVVVSPDGDIVGCGGLYPLGNGTAEIRKMYLLPNVRGQGLGRRLLEDLIDTAKSRRFQRVILETASVLKEAISLYRKRGFEPYQHEHPANRCDQAFVLYL